MSGLYAHNGEAYKTRNEPVRCTQNRRCMRHWFEIATRRDIVHRSLKVASIVGTILALINYWDRFVPYSLDATAYTKIAMTYCVPYCVSTYASVSATLARTKQ